MYLHFSKIVEDIFLLASDSEYVHVEFFPESGIPDALVHHVRGWHQYDFRYAYVIECECPSRRRSYFGSVVVEYFHIEVFRQPVYGFGFSAYIQDIAGIHHCLR